MCFVDGWIAAGVGNSAGRENLLAAVVDHDKHSGLSACGADCGEKVLDSVLSRFPFEDSQRILSADVVFVLETILLFPLTCGRGLSVVVLVGATLRRPLLVVCEGADAAGSGCFRAPGFDIEGMPMVGSSAG